MFVGRAFEELCAAWLMRQALAGALPIEVTSVGSWWGTDPAAKQQTDIDVLAADKVEKRLIIGECKYRNSFDETAEMQKLVAKAGLVKGYTAEHFYFFSKNPMKAASRKNLPLSQICTWSRCLTSTHTSRPAARASDTFGILGTAKVSLAKTLGSAGNLPRAWF
jgi:hypothetical protein